jgi:uncharacterized protein YbcC (UPF0753/DUF2309 family)
MGKSWQKNLKVLDSKQIRTSNNRKERVPDAQMVFCIDTRSELIRRHVEKAMKLWICRFFGIAMDYEDLKDGLKCPYFKLCLPCFRSSAGASH